MHNYMGIIVFVVLVGAVLLAALYALAGVAGAVADDIEEATRER